MKNERNAGRKPKVTEEELNNLISRHESGESISALAAEYGVSRQALYKRIRENNYKPVRIEYYADGQLCTLIEADFRHEDVKVVNYDERLSKHAFGYIDKPKWQDFLDLLEKHYFDAKAGGNKGMFILRDRGCHYSLDDIPEVNGNKRLIIQADDHKDIPVFRFTKPEAILSRSDTDGFQMKAVTSDRRFLIKSQAVMSGVKLRDWIVEIVATLICHQLGIPCVEQKHCVFIYGGQEYHGVYSENFELDGYTFLSFESILERTNRSGNDDEFIKLDAVSKLKWCARILSEASGIPYDRTEKYMLDLAVLDCLIGNIDRHTRNFGLFYNVNTGSYEIPLVFDSGMGLFENDKYRDAYKTFEEAMKHVTIAPYGEDPFDLLKKLDAEFKLKSIYGKTEGFDYGDKLNTKYALEYEKRMNELWQKLG